jgi:hypothetical protein
MHLCSVRHRVFLLHQVLIVPLYTCLFTICLIIFGSVYFDEFGEMSAAHIGGFCGAVAICCIGIAILTMRPVPTDEELEIALGFVCC